MYVCESSHFPLPFLSPFSFPSFLAPSPPDVILLEANGGAEQGKYQSEKGISWGVLECHVDAERSKERTMGDRGAA